MNSGFTMNSDSRGRTGDGNDGSNGSNGSNGIDRSASATVFIVLTYECRPKLPSLCDGSGGYECWNVVALGSDLDSARNIYNNTKCAQAERCRGKAVTLCGIIYKCILSAPANTPLNLRLLSYGFPLSQHATSVHATCGNSASSTGNSGNPVLDGVDILLEESSYCEPGKR